MSVNWKVCGPQVAHRCLKVPLEGTLLSITMKEDSVLRLLLLLFPLWTKLPCYHRLQARETPVASPRPAEWCLPARGAANQPLCQLCWPCPIPRQWSHPSPMPSGESLQRGCATLPGRGGRCHQCLVCASSSRNGSGQTREVRAGST